MGNYWGELATDKEEHSAVAMLINVLDQVIKKKMNDVTRDARVAKMEYLFDVVRHTNVKTLHVPWEQLVQNTLQCMKEHSVSDLFYEIVQEMNPSSVINLVTLYALFVDVVKYRIQNKAVVNTLTELRRLHYYIRLTLGTPVMKLALSILKTM